MAIKLPPVSRPQAKQMAKNLNKALNSEGVEINLHQSQHLLASAFGCNNWQTLKGRAVDSKEHVAVEAFKDYCCDNSSGDLAILLEPLVSALFATGQPRNWSLDALNDLVNQKLAEKARESWLPEDYVDTGLTAIATFQPETEDHRGDAVPVFDGNERVEHDFDIAPFLLGVALQDLRDYLAYQHPDGYEFSDSFAAYCPQYQDHDGPYEVFITHAIEKLLEQVAERFGLDGTDDLTQEQWQMARKGMFAGEGNDEFMCGVVFGNDLPVICKLADGDDFDAADEAANRITSASNGRTNVHWIFGSEDLATMLEQAKAITPHDNYYFSLMVVQGLEIINLGHHDSWEAADEKADALANDVYENNVGVLSHKDLPVLITSIEALLGGEGRNIPCAGAEQRQATHYFEVEVNTMVGEPGESIRTVMVEANQSELTEEQVATILDTMGEEWSLGYCKFFSETELDEKPNRIDFSFN